METIGFVGLGTIGGTVAGNIRKAGYPMMVYDIRPEAVQLPVAQGARAAVSAAEVAHHCRMVFSSLPGSPGSPASRSRTHGALAGYPRKQSLRRSFQQ